MILTRAVFFAYFAVFADALNIPLKKLFEFKE